MSARDAINLFCIIPLRRHRYVFAGITIGVVVFSVVRAIMIGPLYESKATVTISAPVADGNPFDTPAWVRIAEGDDIIEVVRQHAAPEVRGVSNMRKRMKATVEIVSKQPQGTQFSSILELSAKGTTPEQARHITSAWADECIDRFTRLRREVFNSQSETESGGNVDIGPFHYSVRASSENQVSLQNTSNRSVSEKLISIFGLGPFAFRESSNNEKSSAILLSNAATEPSAPCNIDVLIARIFLGLFAGLIMGAGAANLMELRHGK